MISGRLPAMLMPFRRRNASPQQQAPLSDVGEPLRIYAIGDIHGRDDLLAELLELIERDEAKRPSLPRLMIMLGDLVDRGHQSAEVVERAMGLARSGQNWRFVKGNHEEVFVGAARGNAQMARFFRRIGGVETLMSYGLGAERCAAIGDDELALWMLANIPRAHVDFLDAFEDRVTVGDYLFVHAGVRPKVPLEAQDPADLRWIREDFLRHRGHHGRMVIHGHSIRPDIDICPNRIGVDTGAYRTGRLTAIGLEGAERWFIQTDG